MANVTFNIMIAKTITIYYSSITAWIIAANATEIDTKSIKMKVQMFQ